MLGLKLRELYFRGNAISDLSQLQHLAKLPNLRVLWLQDNPCCSDPNYRSTVLQLFPNLRRLDNIGVVSAERFSSTTETDGGEAEAFTKGTDLKVSLSDSLYLVQIQFLL
jgi:Leucine-rich repeat (LRR) protein